MYSSAVVVVVVVFVVVVVVWVCQSHTRSSYPMECIRLCKACTG